MPTTDRERVAFVLFYFAMGLVGCLNVLIVVPFLVPLAWATMLVLVFYPALEGVSGGLAKVADDDDVTRPSLAHLVPGTPAYMAPKSALGAPVDGSADIHALGCIAYDLTARPFRQQLDGRGRSRSPTVEGWEA